MMQPRTQALWFVYVIKRTWEGTRGRKMENSKSIKLIHAAHAKATQAIEQHIAPGYEAGYDACTVLFLGYKNCSYT